MTDEPPTLETPAARPHSRARACGVVLAVSVGFVMAVLDVTVVNVALGDIEREFQAPLTVLVWTIDAYTLTFAALLLLGGAFADRLGAKRAYLLGLIWFVIASAICGMAPSASILVSARLLQGVGAALFMPSSLSLLVESFPDRTVRTRIISIWSSVVAIAAGMGPFIGGVLVDQFGWRSVFYINLPVGLIGLLLTAALLGTSPRKNHPFDIPTHVLITLGLGSMSFVLIQGPTLGWFASTCWRLCSSSSP